MNKLKDTFKIELIASQEKEVWITRLSSGNRYRLPEDEYIGRYKAEKEKRKTFEVIATSFGWGGDGRGPSLLVRALGDELYDDKPTAEQLKKLKYEIESANKDGETVFFL